MDPAPIRLLDRPCTLVFGAAGYGKTTTLRRLLPEASAVWFRRAESARLLDLIAGECPGTAAGHLAGLAGAGSARPVEPGQGCWLVLDDVERLSKVGLRAVLAAAELLPEPVRLVLSTRRPPTFEGIVSGRRRGALTVLGPADLALTPDDVASVLRDDHDLPDPALTRLVYTATAGWPALVHLLAQSISKGRVTGDRTWQTIVEDDLVVGAYLVQEVFPELSAQTRRVLCQAAHLDPVRAELISPAAPARVERALARLVEVGLLRPAGPDGAGYRSIPVVARAVARGLPLPAAEVRQLRGRAATWYAEHGLLAAALRGHQAAGAEAASVRLLRRSGPQLLNEGESATVITAVEALPARLRTPWLRRLHADALRTVGDLAGAVGAYQALGDRGGPLTPALAWRHGLLHYLYGDPVAALAIFDRGRFGDERTADEALLLGWSALAYGMTGDLVGCADRAGRASAAARVVARSTVSGDGCADPVSALAVAQLATSLSATLSGDRSTAVTRLAEAAKLAASAGDMHLDVWIRIEQVLALCGEARYPEASTEAVHVVDVAERIGYAAALVRALTTEGVVLTRLGRLDEAMARYERAVGLCHRNGSRQLAQPLTRIGDLHLLRGRDSLARAAYEEAVRISEPCGSLPVLVPALAGLARVTVRDDPRGAVALAERTVSLACGPEVTVARCASGWVALALSDRARAAELAIEAAGQARVHHDRAGLAEALELRGLATDEPRLAREAYAESAAIRCDIGAAVDADRITVLLGDLPGATPAERIAARLAADRLVGLRMSVPVPGQADRGSRVAVQTLGRFEVVVAGRPVPVSAWQSRKARELLRILTTRPGRAISREQLGELLWPGEDPCRVAHRLSVVLSILRGVLDPGRESPPDRYIVAERASLMLDAEQLDLDVELFRGEALYGLRLVERSVAGGKQDAPGSDRRLAEEARDVLAIAEQRYLGDFLADDPYDDWAAPVRDEVRRLYLRVVRALAALARARSDSEQAAHQLRRALAVEPYDERTHADLIVVLAEAGRHGEADAAYRCYCREMATIGVVPRSRDQLS